MVHLSLPNHKVEIALHHSVVSQEAIEKLKNIEVWVFAYPLYVDAVPAHLLSCLVQLVFPPFARASAAIPSEPPSCTKIVEKQSKHIDSPTLLSEAFCLFCYV